MKIKPLLFWEKSLDILFIPIMRIISGAPTEEPQISHLWNVSSLSETDIKNLDKNLMIKDVGTKIGVIRNRFLPKFHIPILGGWKQYIVISPKHPEAV